MREEQRRADGHVGRGKPAAEHRETRVAVPLVPCTFALEGRRRCRGVALAPRAFVAADIAVGHLAVPFADGYLATDMAYHVLTRQAFVGWLRSQAVESASVTDEL